MINVDLRRYGTDKEYQQFINCCIAGADIDETPVEYQLVRSVKEATVEKVKYLITDFCRDDQSVINNLRAMGYFVYAIRDGEGEHYTVEPKVFVNNIGFIVTDKPIKFHEEGYHRYITDDELAEIGTEDVSIKSVIERAREMEGETNE